MSSGPLLLVLAVFGGISAALILHLVARLLRRHAARFLVVLGWGATGVTVILLPVLLIVGAQYGASWNVFGGALLVLPGIVALAQVQRKQSNIAFGTAFAHLVAEAFGAAMLLFFLSRMHNTLADALCGSDRSGECFGRALESVGQASDYFTVTLIMLLITLELLRPPLRFEKSH